jgi:hypothetical protein
MNIMNGSLKGKVYEGLEGKVELDSTSAEKITPYRAPVVVSIYLMIFATLDVKLVI